MAAGDALEMIHENDVHRGAADRAEHRQRARRRPFGDDDAEARGDLGDQAADHRRRQVGDAALDKDAAAFGGQPADAARARRNSRDPSAGPPRGAPSANTSTQASRASSVDKSSPWWRAMSAMARSISVVVTGNSIGSAAMPKKPLTPPLMPASNDAARRAGGRFDCGSIERMAMLRHLRIAASTILLMRSLAAFGISRIARVDRPAGIIGEPRGKVLIFEVR